MENRPNTEEIIDALELSPHPEGGYYKETYRSVEKVSRQNGSARAAATGIYFLLTEGICTNWHRVSSDELWHFYKGDKLVLEIIDENGKFSRLLLNDAFSGEGRFQQLIPKNCWQRAYSTGAYTLVGCTVAPGFEFDDFEMMEPEKLADRYPDMASKITNDPFSDL